MLHCRKTFRQNLYEKGRPRADAICARVVVFCLSSLGFSTNFVQILDNVASPYGLKKYIKCLTNVTISLVKILKAVLFITNKFYSLFDQVYKATNLITSKTFRISRPESPIAASMAHGQIPLTIEWTRKWQGSFRESKTFLHIHSCKHINAQLDYEFLVQFPDVFSAKKCINYVCM